MQTEHNGQIVATEVELNQVKSLMDNAIDNLVDSFVSLKATTRIGQNLISHMISNENNNRDELNPFRDRQMKSQSLLKDTSATLTKGNAVGLILTGMGKDGAAGMKLMSEKGCINLAQNEASCVVFVMPKEAIAQGGVDEVVPLEKMAARVLDLLGMTTQSPRNGALC